MEELLKEIIENESEDTVLENADIETFKERGLCTMDKGLVLTLENGHQVYLTIQEY